ncbi:hypothetical protein [Hydrogenovibrio sp. SC-1]|nr:hypothetical protein [Hydrogenovibrio sp. SC-1]
MALKRSPVAQGLGGRSAETGVCHEHMKISSRAQQRPWVAGGRFNPF